MDILDESNLLTEAEKGAYVRLLKNHGYEPKDFRLSVTEDQKPMDMNDLNYVIVVKIKATHVKSHKTKIYESRSGSGIWLGELEEDLSTGEFKDY